MTVLCIEELTEADLRVLADHPRRPPVAMLAATDPLQTRAPATAPVKTAAHRADAPRLALTRAALVAGGVS